MATFRLEKDGISLRFGDADTSAPEGPVGAGRAARIVVAVSPPDPRLRVHVQTKVGEDRERTFALRPERRSGGEQFFEGTFQDVRAGDQLSYSVHVELARPDGTIRLNSGESEGGIRHLQVAAAGARRRSAPVRPTTAAGVDPSKPTSESGLGQVARDHLPGASEQGTGQALGEEPIDHGVRRLLVDLLGSDRDAASKLAASLESRGASRPQDLAAMSTVEVSAAIESAGVTAREEAAGLAAGLKLIIGKAFPSDTLDPARVVVPRASVRVGKETIPSDPAVIAGAWKANADLDLLRLDISKDSSDRSKINVAGLTAPERKAFIRDLQVRKGAVRATGNAEIAEKLLNKGIKSPGKVSPARLAEAAGTSLAHAINIHKRDIQHFGRLSHGLFTLIDAHSGGLQNLAVGNLRRENVVDFVRRADTSETFDSLDNIEELFGDLDSCACKHCNSILGPAAYFVDLLHFVRTHVLDEDVAEGEAPFKGRQSHRLHLKTRRPDLWVLPLTCENTHTEIPQLQITGEIFENFIARKRGTAVTAERSPVVAAVYGTILPAGRHSVLQPFHLPTEELQIYLSHFKLGRGNIAETLDEPEEDQLRTVLGLSRVHADLMTIADASATNIHNKLGLSVPADGILPIKKLLTATQLPRKDLGELLQSKFVGGAQPLTISAEKKSAESVQFDIERVHGVTLGHLDRVHRLLRLQRHLPWRPKELDGFIASSSGRLDGQAVADAGRAALLKERFKASIQELCALAGDLPDFSIERTKRADDKERSPLDILFNVPDLMREEASYPSSSIRYSPSETTTAAKERAMRLRAGLRLDEADLTALVEGVSHALVDGAPASAATVNARLFGLRLRNSPRPARPDRAPPEPVRALPPAAVDAGSFTLSTRNLSLLHRHAVLARWLKLNVTDLLTLIRLAPDVGDHVANLRDALAVVRFYDWWKSTPLSLEDLSLLLAPVDALDGQLEDLWKAVQAWLAEQEPAVLVETFLTQVEGVTEKLSRRLVAANLGKVLEPNAGGGFRVIETSSLADLDLTLLNGTGVDAEAVRLLLRSYHPDERLPRAITQALKVDIDLARAIVSASLSGKGAKATDLLKPGELVPSLKPAIAAVLRLHRIGGVLKLAPLTLTFFARHQTVFGVSAWNESNPKALRRTAAVQALLKGRFRADPSPALVELERLFQNRDALPEVAVALLGLEPALARDLAATLRVPDNVIDALFRLERYAELATRLGVDASALSGIVSEDYAAASSASAAVIAGFRAKYPDEATWKEKVEPYQERVLERKRDALIDYLLHGPDAEFPDAREMYKYFLIDGEVDGCFRTSRVVAASSSLQLYVHRIGMNLEKEPNGGLHVQPSLIPDEEWEWRQHYRVWEANRKIFLWPENYLDPTIRDDKTPLFEALESELLQQEITEQTVIDAYSNYLEGLEELANLRYAGAYHHYADDDESGEVTDIIYLFGATGGDAPTHYWREIHNLARSQEDELVSPQYGPWRKVETRIPTRHVSPVVYDGKLHVFWNEITTTPQNAVDEGKSRFIGYSHRYVLKFTSLRLDGQWTPPESVALRGAAPTFEETNSSIDDPLAEAGTEMGDFKEAFFAKFLPWFGMYRDPEISYEEAYRRILTPRWGVDMHSKSREGYTLDGFMWERPYVSLDPSYGHRLLVNCAGFLVRGAIDLFDRQILRANDTRFLDSNSVGSDFLAYRSEVQNLLNVLLGMAGASKGSPDFSLLRRDGDGLWQTTWSSCPFDYPVAAAIALNSPNAVLERHWRELNLPTGNKAAEVSEDAGVWAVAGTPGETVIETEDEMFLLQPSATVTNHYVLHRLGTTLVRDVARKLFADGVDGLLATAHQLGLAEPDPDIKGPRTHDRTIRNPIANDAAYGIYYQEIFQHIPLLIAYHLNAQGKFEQAQRWYHYVFDPTSPEPPTDTKAPATDRNWKYRQFRGLEQAKLRDVLSDTAAIQKYREEPFNAHAIARLRVSAYQKAVVMRYIDNLLDWADERFTRFQMETVNQAMMLYVTAAEILGPRPVQLGECGELSDSTRTYDKLKDAVSKDGEFLLEVEQLIPQPARAVPPSAGPALLKPAFGLKGLLAFPLGAAAIGGAGTSIKVGGKSAIAVAIGKAPAASASAGGLLGNSAGVLKASSGSASLVATSQPTSTPGAGTAKGGAQPGGMVANAMKGSMATKASKGTTGFLVAEGEAGGKVAAASAGALLTGAVPFVKAAIAQPRTEALVKSFALRQKFQFLGGRWKLNGGHRIPSTLGDRFGRALVRQVSAAFCIPRNEILEGYWDRVEDRIQKIRTCRDITGRKRKLSLFAPQIDPMLLGRVRAAGIALEDALGAFDGMVPLYRFSYLLQKAKEFTGTVQSFGAALQSALERKDAEELVRLQTTQQQQILTLTTKNREWELESANANLAATQQRKMQVENRRAHYYGLLEAGLNNWEVTQSIATHTASVIRGTAAISNFVAAVLGLAPDIGSPFAMKYGGDAISKGPANVALALGALADLATNVAASASLEAGWDRRSEDWQFQRDQSEDELSQIEKQIQAAEIARDLAEHAITLHEKNIKHNDEVLEYHEDKFSSLGLYTWLASELQRTYREAYSAAERMARYAEQAYRFEREDYTSELLSGQYWESSRAGLLAGNRLTLGLQHLEQRYIETDHAKREITEHFFSLRQWDPNALIQLRQNGECKFKVPELFFDLASPGDYRRRLRSVRVTIPAVAGPYINVMATLSLDKSQMRYEPSVDPQDAPRPRVESITTSSARNDAGAFELNFHGEKYVPFEGAGAVSEWSLSLPTAVRMFDYSTISDVILHLDYTASFDGVHRDVVQGVATGIVASVQERLAREGMVRAFSLKDEFPGVYLRLLAGETAEIEITPDHLPFFLRSAQAQSTSTLVFSGLDEGETGAEEVTFDDVSLGRPATDDDTGALRVSIPVNGGGPWKHKLRIKGLSARSNVYLSLRLGSGSAFSDLKVE